MDGFNLIPKENTAADSGMNLHRAKPVLASNDIGSVKIQPRQNKPIDIIMWAAVLVVGGVLVYFVYLVVMRFLILNQINSAAQDLQQRETQIDRSKLENLKTIDQRLKVINNRISKHILVNRVFDTVNKYIRTTAQISEYQVVVSDTELYVTLSEITPSFKDMAEQTERLIDLKNQKVIQAFTVSNLSYEEDTKRVRFTLKINLDKSNYAATSLINTKP